MNFIIELFFMVCRFRSSANLIPKELISLSEETLTRLLPNLLDKPRKFPPPLISKL